MGLWRALSTFLASWWDIACEYRDLFAQNYFSKNIILSWHFSGTLSVKYLNITYIEKRLLAENK